MRISWFKIRQVTRALWFLPALFSAFAVAVVAAAYFSSLLFPDAISSEHLPIQISADSVMAILTSVASSMLAISVFALSSLANMLANVSSTGSPRAVSLFVQDRTAQTSISVFIGAFLFSIVAIIGLSGEIYSTVGRLILFVATLIVVLAIVWALIRWIGQISSVGRVNETTARIERATRAALARLGPDDLAATGPRRLAGMPIKAGRIGFLQHFDRGMLQSAAEEHDLSVHVLERPGAYVDFDTTLALVRGKPSQDCAAEIREAFVVGDNRTFDYDPGFGLTVLAEVAERALSPGINDSGTAVHIVTVQTRLLGEWLRDGYSEKPQAPYDRVSVAPLDPAELAVQAFEPILVNAAESKAVSLATLRALATLARLGPSDFGAVARRMAAELSARADLALSLREDREAVKAAAAEVIAVGAAQGAEGDRQVQH